MDAGAIAYMLRRSARKYFEQCITCLIELAIVDQPDSCFVVHERRVLLLRSDRNGFFSCHSFLLSSGTPREPASVGNYALLRSILLYSPRMIPSRICFAVLPSLTILSA